MSDSKKGLFNGQFVLLDKTTVRLKVRLTEINYFNRKINRD